MENEVKDNSQLNENRLDNSLPDSSREVLKELNLNKSEQQNVLNEKTTTTIMEKPNTSLIAVADAYAYEKSMFENFDPQTSLLVNLSTGAADAEDPLKLDFEAQQMVHLDDTVGTTEAESRSANETIDIKDLERSMMDCNETPTPCMTNVANMSFEPMDVDESMNENVYATCIADSVSVVEEKQAEKSLNNTTMSFKDATETNLSVTPNKTNDSQQSFVISPNKESFPITEVVMDSKQFPTSPNSIKHTYNFPTSPKFFEQSNETQNMSIGKPELSESTETDKELENNTNLAVSSAPAEETIKSEVQANENINIPIIEINTVPEEFLNSKDHVEEDSKVCVENDHGTEENAEGINEKLNLCEKYLEIETASEDLSNEKIVFESACESEEEDRQHVGLNTTINIDKNDEEEKNVTEKESEFKVPVDLTDFDCFGDNFQSIQKEREITKTQQIKTEKNQQFKIPPQQLGAFGDSEFCSNIILDPADFDYLLTKGNSNVQVNRNSILLRFDPLLGAAVPVNVNKQQRLDDILNASKQHGRKHSGEESSSSSSSREKLINQTISEEECHKKGSCLMPNVSTQEIMSTNAAIDSESSIQSQSNNCEKERNVINCNMDEIETKIKNEVLKTEDVERKLKEAEQREESLIKRITEKDKLINKQNGVIEAYERAIAEFVSEKEVLVQNYEKQLAEVKADRDANFRHLSSLETTFSDLHVKFEKSKAMTQQLQASQELLVEERKKALDNLRQQEQRYLKMKNHAMEQLEIANKKLESLTREHQMEMTKLKALLKKEEITRASINEQLVQKSKENAELMKICDELINGEGSS